jgi:hypothetical protein
VDSRIIFEAGVSLLATTSRIALVLKASMMVAIVVASTTVKSRQAALTSPGRRNRVRKEEARRASRVHGPRYRPSRSNVPERAVEAKPIVVAGSIEASRSRLNNRVIIRGLMA